MDPSYRHLAFLLSIGGVPLACVGDDSSTSGDSATTGTSATTSTTGTTADTTGDASTSSTGSSSGTTAETTTTTGDTGETTGGPASPACEAYAEKYIECFPRYTLNEAIAYCEESRSSLLASGEDGCGDAFDALYVCLAGATCDQLSGQEQGDICPEPYLAMINTCLGVGDTCSAFAGKHDECYDNPDPFIGAACQMELDYAAGVSTECGDAQEEYFACLNGLDCADFPDGIGCESKLDALDMACG